jgi:hypothetical protein
MPLDVLAGPLGSALQTRRRRERAGLAEGGVGVQAGVDEDGRVEGSVDGEAVRHAEQLRGIADAVTRQVGGPFGAEVLRAVVLREAAVDEAPVVQVSSLGGHGVPAAGNLGEHRQQDFLEELVVVGV